MRICSGKSSTGAVISQEEEAPVQRLPANGGRYLQLPQRKNAKGISWGMRSDWEAPVGLRCDSGEAICKRRSPATSI